jgi:phosphohistidine phosphatase
MEVYLIRHGLAGERGTYADDEQRPLTNKGRQKTTKVAEGLLTVGVKFDLILSSPLVRASQTAEILQKQGLSSAIQTYSPLKPDGEIEEWLQWLQQWQPEHPNSTLALVGHEPDLGNWAERLIWGTAQAKLVVKKAGVIGLTLPSIGTPIARSTLFLLTSPKWFI